MDEDKNLEISPKAEEEKEKPLDLRQQLIHDITGLDLYPRKSPEIKRAS